MIKMGDRGNIVVDGVWMYTHWDGCNIKDILKKALIRGKDRWDDSQYLARIIFCELVPAEEWQELTHYGLSISIGDNDHSILVVDTDKQQVMEHEEGTKEQKHLGDLLHTWSFEEFVAEKKQENAT